MSKLVVLIEPAVLPTCQAFHGSDPEGSVTRSNQALNIGAREAPARWRTPCGESNPIEPHQAEFGPQPEVSVGSLSNGADRALDRVILEGPCSVRVLSDIEVRVKRKKPLAATQPNAQGNRGYSCALFHGGSKS